MKAPWVVVQYNFLSPDIDRYNNPSYKPVYIKDAEGKKILRVGDTSEALPLANLIVEAINERQAVHTLHAQEIAKWREVMLGVIRVADRATDEFDAARALVWKK